MIYSNNRFFIEIKYEDKKRICGFYPIEGTLDLMEISRLNHNVDIVLEDIKVLGFHLRSIEETAMYELVRTR